MTYPCMEEPAPQLVTRHPRRVLRSFFAPPEPLWLLGAHGGAGVYSLKRAGVPGVDAECRWPDTPVGARVVVVCRSSASGLAAAQDAALTHAHGIAPAGTVLLGLIVVADGPKITRQLRGKRVIVGGAFERHWNVPWIEEWRHLADGPLPAPPAVRDLANELRELSCFRPTPEGDQQ